MTTRSEQRRASALSSPHRRKPPQWPSDGLPEGAMAPWLDEALRCSVSADPRLRPGIFKSRSLMRKVVALVDGDPAFAKAMAVAGRKVALDVVAIAASDLEAARRTAISRASGEIGHGAIATIARAKDPREAARKASIPAWPLEHGYSTPMGPEPRWDKIAFAKAASGLTGDGFAAAHGLHPVRVRKCVMIMKAARTLADGCKERASKIIAMSESQILAKAKAARNTQARRCHLDEKKENGRMGSIETPRDR